jgi:hypothetical protein
MENKIEEWTTDDFRNYIRDNNIKEIGWDLRLSLFLDSLAKNTMVIINYLVKASQIAFGVLTFVPFLIFSLLIIIISLVAGIFGKKKSLFKIGRK